ncbi:hypothetical protein FA95DRAFT_1411809 [Auriscalpium vulgare]|uniref:Uncharacterized protein n=1 Tax=Auriscalpium vulgare TaxID=40419 RepID=A0ACB8RQ77_9AGAM|nr:hypothetical protein FA95DRAFT_1411809 [Auriscalpium vulgare]
MKNNGEVGLLVHDANTPKFLNIFLTFCMLTPHIPHWSTSLLDLLVFLVFLVFLIFVLVFVLLVLLVLLFFLLVLLVLVHDHVLSLSLRRPAPPNHQARHRLPQRTGARLVLVTPYHLQHPQGIPCSEAPGQCVH